MSRLVHAGATWDLTAPEKEAEFEKAIVDHSDAIFGPNRIYIDCKRRIGKSAGIKNIPDGYLVDLTSKTKPRLYVVENELSSHPLYKHIGQQLLEFSVSFKSTQRLARDILLDQIRKDKETRKKCEEYVRDAGLRNLDRMVSYLVEDQPFRALLIIDTADEELFFLLKRFSFDVEVIEFEEYKSESGESIFRFTPFEAELEETIRTSRGARVDIADLDTIVVPAREEGFTETFLGEDRWYAVRISPSMRPQLEYIAAYQVAPISAITHVAKVRSIEPWLDSGKYSVNFVGPASEIGPLRLVPKGKVKHIQGPRYAKYSTLRAAKNLDEAF